MQIEVRDEEPDDVFMLRVIDEPRMKGVTGQARYREEFSTSAHASL
jgi:hypothetical protein